MRVNSDLGGNWLTRFASNSGYAAALLATSWLAPIIAAGVTVAVYLSGTTLPKGFPWSDHPAVSAGLIAGFFGWLLLALLGAGLANAMNANRGSYGELVTRLAELSARLERCQDQAGGATSGTACAEARRHRYFLSQELTSAGPRWVDATGYIAAWKRLHRAEEVLFEVESRSELLTDALHDELRLTGSPVEHAKEHLALIAAAKKYLQDHVLGAAGLSQPRPAAAATPDALASPITSELEARASLRVARTALNSFRDDSWEAIVRHRNRLARGVLLVELAAYGFLGLAIVGGPPKHTIQAAMAFLAMGSVIGLFNQVAKMIASDPAVEDYSLATARLIATPVFAGLGAVIGVFLVGTLYSEGLAGVFQSGGSGGAPREIPRLVEIYDLQKFPLGLLVAAVFGLVPSLATDRLQGLADRYKSDIKQTEPATATPPATG